MQYQLCNSFQIGKDVCNVKVGDRVCMEPGVPDPNSRETRMGMYNACRKLRFWATPPYAQNLLDGTGMFSLLTCLPSLCCESSHTDPAWAAGHGSLRPSVVHPAEFTFKLPSNVSFDEGAMVEPLAVGMHAATKAEIRPGDRVSLHEFKR